jgi:WD40-like Beta Propeller Repeat
MTRQHWAPAAARRAAWRTLVPVAGALLVLAAGAAPVAADEPARYSDWGAPTAVTEVNTAAHDGCPIESPNGLRLYIASTRAGGFGKNDIWVASRPDKQSAWGPMRNLGSAINTADQEYCPTPLPGRKLLFVSDRTACGATPGMTPPVGDIYITKKRADGTWRAPRHLGCVANGTGPNFSGGEFGPSLREIQGVTWLYFSSTGTNGNHDIYRSRKGVDGTFKTPEPVTELNTAGVDQMPNVSRDGTEIVFASNRGGNMDIWTARLDPATGRWSTPVPVAAVNTAEPESRPSFSQDGVRLYFGRGATADIYLSTRVKVAGDGS